MFKKDTCETRVCTDKSSCHFLMLLFVVCMQREKEGIGLFLIVFIVVACNSFRPILRNEF